MPPLLLRRPAPDIPAPTARVVVTGERLLDGSVDTVPLAIVTITGGVPEDQIGQAVGTSRWYRCASVTIATAPGQLGSNYRIRLPARGIPPPRSPISWLAKRAAHPREKVAATIPAACGTPSVWITGRHPV